MNESGDLTPLRIWRKLSLQLVVIRLGIGVDYEGKYPVLPGGGIRWKFAPQWVLNAVLPQPRLEYELNSKMLLYAGAEFRSKNFRVDDDFVGGVSDPGRLNNAILSYTEVRTGAGLVWRIGDSCKLSIEAGYRRIAPSILPADVRLNPTAAPPIWFPSSLRV